MTFLARRTIGFTPACAYVQRFSSDSVGFEERRQGDFWAGAALASSLIESLGRALIVTVWVGDFQGSRLHRLCRAQLARS